MNKIQRISLLGLVLGLLVAGPYIGLPVHLQSLLYVIFYWITLTTSWSMLSGYSGYFSFGHGAFFGVGMYSMATLATKADWPVVPAALGSGLLAALLALAIGALVFNVRKIRGESFALSSFFAGVMGSIHALYVSYVTVGETFNITVPLTVVLMSVLGGSRHWAGPMLGGILITLLLNAFTAGDSALVGKMVIGLVLAGAVLVMPRGILGTWQLRQHKRLIQSNKDAAASHEEPGQSLDDSWVPDRPTTRPSESPDRVKVLQVHGLSKNFSGMRALNQVDLDLYQGEILGLLGPNGSGKSTFINVVTGHYRPTEGTVLLQGHSCAGWSAHRIRRQGLSRTYQIPRPFHGLTVLQNVTLAAHFGSARLTDAQAQEEALTWMRFTGLQDKGDHFPDELNLHQRKFLELARALVARPQVLLLDEVLSGLTPAEIGAAVQTIRRIRERGTSIVFVEHVMSAVLALSDRLVVLNQGEVIAEGTPEDVMGREEVVWAYLGDEAMV